MHGEAEMQEKADWVERERVNETIVAAWLDGWAMAKHHLVRLFPHMLHWMATPCACAYLLEADTAVEAFGAWIAFVNEQSHRVVTKLSGFFHCRLQQGSGHSLSAVFREHGEGVHIKFSGGSLFFHTVEIVAEIFLHGINERLAQPQQFRAVVTHTCPGHLSVAVYGADCVEVAVLRVCAFHEFSHKSFKLFEGVSFAAEVQAAVVAHCCHYQFGNGWRIGWCALSE